MVQALPTAHACEVTLEYRTLGTGTAAVGHFTAVGKIDTYTLISGTAINPPDKTSFGGFKVDLYFNQLGKLLVDRNDNALTVTGFAGEMLFKSTRAYGIVESYGPKTATQAKVKYEVLWQKIAGSAAGSLPGTSAMPFIGSLITSDTGKVTYQSAATVGSFAFAPGTLASDSLLFANAPLGGSANTFMTPSPAAGAGGIALMAGLFARRGRRAS